MQGSPWPSLTSVFGRRISEGFGEMYRWSRQSPATLSSRKVAFSTARRTQGKPAGTVPMGLRG